MANTVEYFIKLSLQNAESVKKIAGDTDNLNKAVNKATAGVKMLGAALGGLLALHKITGSLKESEQAYIKQSEVEIKLTQVMKNTMNARNDEIKSILELTSAQQKLGVIGDEVQLAGAQELATYLTQKSTLEKLIPVMNDMAAQQYGYNVSQEQTAQIASMLGKVMDGQVGALSRYGYKFDELQEKILKNGTEAQRAAVLFDVVSSAVGGMNAALAQTPEGIDKQYQNDLGDIQERIGKVWVMVKQAFMPVRNFFKDNLDAVAGFFEENQDTIVSIVGTTAKVINKVLKGLSTTVKIIFSVLKTVWSMAKAVFPYLTAALGLYATYMIAANFQTIVATVRLAAYNAVMLLVRGATLLWAGAQAVLNAVLTANPVALIVTAVVALIAAIAYVIYKTDGWGKTWSNVVSYLGTSWDLFVQNFRIKWLEIQDFFMGGIGTIQKGWYNLQKLWDKDAANAGLASLENQRNERAREIAEAKGIRDNLRQQLKDMTVWEVTWNNERSLSDFTKSIGQKLGISAPVIPGTGSTGGSGKLPDTFNSSTEAIATGGTRSTNVSINIGNVVENMSFNGGKDENIRNMGDEVLDALLRVINTSQAGFN